MNYVRRCIFSVITFVFIYFAWYGAEMIIHGQSQRSYVDLAIAIIISLVISGKLEKGAEENERRKELAEKFTEKFVEHIKDREETKGGKDASK